ncbi:MAG TPA: radical SAM protein, partial [Chloroflexota bacterium]|nr:radical SAM protein [Chloroflexota bacterium]
MTATPHPDRGTVIPPPPARAKQDADYIFYELTRSICPACRQPIDAQVLLRDNKVYLRKRCLE